MKLFLSSLALSADQLPHFVELVGKNPSQIKMALIENGADAYEGTPAWLTDNFNALNSHGMNIEKVDLRKVKDPATLHKTLSGHDVIWLGGGNSYYLRWILSKSGADKVIADLVNQGKVYGGGSAGAIVAGPTLNHFQAADDPEQSPELILEGLKLTDVVIVPHMDNAKFAPIISGINQALIDAGYDTAPLNDSQALVIDGPRHHRI